MRRSLQKGVALVVTLIMLSVITVIVVAFLAVARRERSAVAQSSYTATAKFMADTGFERAKALILSQIIATTNLLEPDLAVSRNYINPLGFVAGRSDLTNVSYTYPNNTNEIALSQPDLLQNLNNLLFDPRPPVFINISRDPTKRTNVFRYYIDLNRNRRFDESGWVDNKGYLTFTNNNTNWEFQVGDPQWIGMLEQPTFRHSRTNQFVGRYAFLVQPVGKSLDINYIYNNAKNTTYSGSSYGFYRNQGYGSWEINLAAFLADLNTNQWNPPANAYWYNPDSTSPNPHLGAAFWAAQGLLGYRYNGALVTRAIDLLPIPPFMTWHPFVEDCIDNYANGPWLRGNTRMTLNDEQGTTGDDPTRPWPGSSGTNRFFTAHDYFPSPKKAGSAYYNDFSTGLTNASARGTNYDRYTYYRLLSQMNTDSAAEPPQANLGALFAKIAANRPQDFPPEPVGKINLNYDNLRDRYTDYSATNFVPWDPTKFFTNVANVLLRAHYPFGLNIPVYPTNYYTPGVHRLLQLAANIYDASTNSPYPSVFRPIYFTNAARVVFVVSYTNDNNAATVNTWPNNETYGVPFIVGAKKGIPNFNEYVSQTHILASRKLELQRLNTNTPVKLSMTNEMFILSISNLFALESWNSYTQTFKTDVTLALRNDVIMSVTTNGFTNVFWTNGFTFTITTNIPANTWPGFNGKQLTDIRSFKLPLFTNAVVLNNSIYRATPIPQFEPVGSNIFVPTPGFSNMHWGLVISNRLTYMLSTTSDRKILDYVHLRNLNSEIDISGKLMGLQGETGEPTAINNCWLTNRTASGATEGIVNQINISLGSTHTEANDWRDYNYQLVDKQAGIDSFRAFFGLTPLYTTNTIVNVLLTNQAPFAPTRKIAVTTSWQVNDPLVHHLAEHLKDVTNNTTTLIVRPTSPVFVALNLTNLNERYMPWGGNPKKELTITSEYLGVKDPGIWKSYDWDFPTNKFPSIGWLGRIHRGTPWQTIYLKAEPATAKEWQDQFLDLDNGMPSHPTNDWRLIDIFTVAIHPNASHGQLSINQTNLAAWSAVLGGVTVLSNPPISDDALDLHVSTNFIDWVIDPTSPQLYVMFTNITHRRLAQPGQTFRRLGDLLQVPELTIGDRNLGYRVSPFLKYDEPETDRYMLNDAAIERIPQQIFSLLKVGDARYVVYAFGQSLKPAENSIVTSGPFFGTCTNYQITGETAIRAVLRIDGNGRTPRPVVESFNLLPVE